MPDKTYPAGTWTVTVSGLGRITRVGRHAGTDGCWIASATNDPGTRGSFGYPGFVQWWHVRPAVIGVTVCPQPLYTHWCGLHHVTEADLATLRKAGAVKPS